MGRKVENLINASSTGNANEVAQLIKEGADVDAANDDGWTALMFAAREGHPEIVELLLSAGADSEIINHDLKTALEIVYEKTSYEEIHDEDISDWEDFWNLQDIYECGPYGDDDVLEGYYEKAKSLKEYLDYKKYYDIPDNYVKVIELLENR